jgi:hypothetical protein
VIGVTDSPAFEQESPLERERVEIWRAHVLVKAGYPGELAIEIARRHDVDLHQAVDLVKRGCPHETAGRILL